MAGGVVTAEGSTPVGGLTSEDGLAREIHRAFHEAWPGPSQPLDLYADSPIWQSMAALLADRERRARVEALREAADNVPAVVAVAFHTRQRINNWLRYRADRIEAGS